MNLVSRVLPVFCLLIIFAACKKKFTVTPYSSEEIGRYIAARVPAMIDPSDPVMVRFSAAPDTSITKDILEFNPSINGTTYWEDGITLAFKPDNGWKPGQVYQMQINLDRVIADVDPKMKKVVFEFEVRPLRVLVNLEPLVPEFEGDQPTYLLRGRVITSTSVDSQKVQNVLSVKGISKPVSWFHNAEQRIHEFVIADIPPDANVDFRWDGASIGSEDKGNRKVVVPKSNVMSVLSVVPTNDGQKKIEIHFSQKLNPSQELAGLVTINGSTEGFTTRKQDHILSIYPNDENMTGQLSVQLHSQISSTLGYSLEKTLTMDVSLEDSRPAVRLVGSGVITPGNADIVFPFEAINLKSVDVEIFRIFENNILQYLQQSSLEDQWNLEPVGHIIMQKKIDLTELSDADNRSVWTRYALDLAPLVKLAPGSIYQVRIGFSGADTYLDCYHAPVREEDDGLTPYGEMTTMWEYDYSYEGFTWDHTEDPCYPAYYNPEKFIRRNILASDIALVAKQNDEGKIWIYASSLENVSPKSGMEIEIYDFQQQLLLKGETSGQGELKADLPRKAFFIVATDGDQKGYLRMPDGISLSLSEFNAGGAGYQEGLRGYIYTERDVWRPGDTVHLNFILWDPEGKVDSRHPVRLTVTNPLGQKRIEKTSPLSIGGIYDLSFATSAVDPTGTWMAKVEVGNADFSKGLRIETIKPNRLKIDVKLPKSITGTLQNQSVELEADWLFGAPASNLKAVVEAQFSPLDFDPEGFREYHFTDPARVTPNTVTTVFEGSLNQDGKAQIKIPDIRESLPEGQLSLSIKTRVFETGGDFSTDRHSTTYHPYDHYAGVSVPVNRWGYEELKMNEVNQIKVASVNTAGKGVGGRQLSVGVYNANWRWWWDRMGPDIAQYNSELHIGAIAIDTITTANNGTATYKVTPSSYGSYMIRVCDMASGHCSGQFYYAGSWGDPSSAQNAASRLTFTADKESYEVGDRIRLNVPSASGSKLLLTIEKNNKVLSSKWYEASGDQTQISIEATAEMMPNVYAFVSHIQPYEHFANEMPLRMYGVLPIMVADPATMLHPEITTPPTVKPQEIFTVAVSERDKQAMAYTIAIVDEGLLGLTRFESPDPWTHFHQQEALAVQTWDIYDHVLGGYGGAIDRLLSIGGDGVAALVDAPQAQRFKPVVMHLGPFYLNAGEKKQHQIKMPNYVGAVRAMVVASDRKRWGSAEKTVTVKSDLMIQSTLPRLVSPGENIVVPVNVYAMSDQVRAVEVVLTTNEMASMVGSSTQSIQFTAQGDKLVNFNIKIPERPGLLKVKVTAKSGSITSTQEIELDVRLPNPPLTDVEETVVAAGQKWSGKIPLPGMKGTNVASVELSQMPSINLNYRLQYLIQYPYGCLEQTLSSVFPQLYLAALTDLKPAQEQEIKTNIQAGINRLRTFTIPSGGFSYWPGERSRDSWSNSYAGHFLVEASHAGYHVDKSMMDGWRSSQKKDAQAYRRRDYYREDVLQAYRLYTLALDGDPQWGLMNRLRAESNLDPMASWLLAGAYATGKRNDVAKAIIEKLSTDVKPYQELSFTYGSELRDKAIILETFLQMGQQHEAMDVAKSIASILSSDYWYSTQSTSFALLAMGKLAKNFTGAPIKAVVTQTGKGNETLSSTKRLITRTLDVNHEQVTIENQSADPLYVRITTTGRPLKGVSAEVKNNLSLKAKYLNMQGKEISPDRLVQGQDFIVQLSVTNPGTFTANLDQMALSYLFPSGWELTNTRMDQFNDRFNNSPFRYQDIRDDRVNTFFNMGRGVVTYSFVMTATYAGRYWLPDIMAEAMYSHQARARIPGRWVEVVQANDQQNEVQ